MSTNILKCANMLATHVASAQQFTVGIRIESKGLNRITAVLHIATHTTAHANLVTVSVMV